MNKMLRRKKRPQPYQPKKSKPSKRVWHGEASDLDRYYAAIDPRQMQFPFYGSVGLSDGEQRGCGHSQS